MKIYINPGHSVDGEDHGACAFGLREADIALNIGRRVETYLRAVGYQVKLGQFDNLQPICDDANSWYADYFASIHCNAAANSKACGTETFYASPAGENLAKAIQRQIVQTLGTFDRRVERRNHYVTTHTDMPAVLVETAFISNPDEAKLLVDREDDFARAIARGITDFFKEQIPTKQLPNSIDAPKNPAKLSKNFDAEEFVCHCCGKGADKIDARLIELLEELRAKVNASIHINCGYRCPKHNAEVGGVPDSQHVKGTAADIYVPKVAFDKVRQIIESMPFDGVGVYPPLETGGLWFIHTDTRSGGIADRYFWEG